MVSTTARNGSAEFGPRDERYVANGPVDIPRIIPRCQATSHAASHTILLAEDEGFTREAIAAALRSVGYTVLTAEDGRQALSTCRNVAHHPDLLLCDMVMPGMSGAHLAAVFEALYPWARVLLMSGYAEELGDSTRDPHDRAQLRKPFSIETLVSAIGEMLGGVGAP